MTKNMPKTYEPGTFEDKWYDHWTKEGYFTPKVEPGKERFSLVMPPPNITGSLHIGHALDVAVQDIIVRRERMLGKVTLWLPGTDHASIATHAKIEEALRNEGTSRQELGRERFLERAWEWKDKYGHIITDQIKSLGASCDWSRLRFTMDEGCSDAVTEVFVRLYEEGLIYKGEYMVNYCPGCGTVISDVEVEHEEIDGSLWYISYPIQNSDRTIEIATTRPETMLGDTAIAVHPEDPRYQDLVGKHAVLPLVGRLIPIIPDEHVDPEFGTGAVKVTPAHDPNDFEMGRKHGLPSVTVIGFDGKMTPAAGERYAGLDRFKCRRQVVEDLLEGGFLGKTEPHRHSVGHCHRCETIAEPLVSLQWFVRMAPLAGPAISAVRDGSVKFAPERFTKIYLNWMENVRDWCISRQLWWGHRIPAWYCQDCGKIHVARSAPKECTACGGSLRQDEDVLDTWFSSGLWPFSTLGWPEQTEDFQYFFPTNVLESGWDIIFFWDARMIFLSLKFTGKIPFEHAVIHGMVRDEQGRKMSKSKGTGVDPLEMIERFGADSLRLSLTVGTAMGNDMRLFDDKVMGSRNFLNKLWNAARYCLSNMEGWTPPGRRAPRGLASRYITSRLARATKLANDALSRFEQGEAAGILWDFVWDEFCDWYIEITKTDLAQGGEAAEEARITLWTLLADSLALLHPFVPFVTEELWSYLPWPKGESKSDLAVSPYPVEGWHPIDMQAEREIGLLIEATKAIRNMRAEVGIPTGKKASVILAADDPEEWKELLPYMKGLAWADPISLVGRDEMQAPGQALVGVAVGAAVYLPLEGIIDIEKEIARLDKAVAELERDRQRTLAKLSDPNFLSRAPKEIVETQRKRFDDTGVKLETLRSRRSMLDQNVK